MLWVICYKLRHESDSVAALAQDHRNDVISNTLTLICIAVVRQYPNLWWLDNVVAMALMVFIIITWTMTGKGHVQQLTGRVAEKDQLSQITYLAMNHDVRVQLVDTVRAYYIGSKLLVEVRGCPSAAAPQFPLYGPAARFTHLHFSRASSPICDLCSWISCYRKECLSKKRMTSGRACRRRWSGSNMLSERLCTSIMSTSIESMMSMSPLHKCGEERLVWQTIRRRLPMPLPRPSCSAGSVGKGFSLDKLLSSKK